MTVYVAGHEAEVKAGTKMEDGDALLVIEFDDGSKRMMFAHEVSADGGLGTIMEKVEEAPMVSEVIDRGSVREPEESDESFPLLIDDDISTRGRGKYLYLSGSNSSGRFVTRRYKLQAEYPEEVKEA